MIYSLRPKHVSVNLSKKHVIFSLPKISLVLALRSLDIKFVNINITIKYFCGFVPLTKIFMSDAFNRNPSVLTFEKNEWFFLPGLKFHYC